MLLKDLAPGKRMDIATAREHHQSILSRLMSGPGDSEGAMHRAESMFGLPYWSQHALRYKRRVTIPFMQRVHQAYLHIIETSVRRDLERLRIEQSKGDTDAALAGLVAEAEALLARISERVKP